jgi:hypothetical protein
VVYSEFFLVLLIYSFLFSSSSSSSSFLFFNMWVAGPTNYPTKPSVVVDDVIAAVCFGALHITNSKMLIPHQLDDSSVGRGDTQDGKDLASPHNLLIHLPPRPAPPRPHPSHLHSINKGDGTGLNVHWHVTCRVPSVCLSVCQQLA